LSEDFMLPTFHLFSLAWLPCAALLLSSPAAMAQAVARPDPVTAAAVPPLTHESPFARYRAYADQEVAPWRETNDTAGRIGGWREYAREAAEPAGGTTGKASERQNVAPAAAGHDHKH